MRRERAERAESAQSAQRGAQRARREQRREQPERAERAERAERVATLNGKRPTHSMSFPSVFELDITQQIDGESHMGIRWMWCGLGKHRLSEP